MVLRLFSFSLARSLIVSLIVGLGVPLPLASKAQPLNVFTAPSCFDGQVDSPVAERAVSSTMHLVTIDMYGNRRLSGTAFVVHDSAGPEGYFRMVTASHNLRDLDISAPSSRRLMIEDSSGRPIAFVRAVAYVLSPKEQTDSHPTRGDVAVIAIDGFLPGARSIYQAIRGLDIATNQSYSLLSGIINQPAGIDGGVSGAPMVASDGTVVGIVVVKSDKIGVPTVVVRGGDVIAMNNAGVMANGVFVPGVFTQKDINLPMFSVIYAEPLSFSGIRSALGTAGMGIKPMSDADAAAGEVLIPSYPQSVCVIFHGNVTPLVSKTGSLGYPSFKDIVTAKSVSFGR